MDTVSWFINPTPMPLSICPNPNVRLLVRQVAYPNGNVETESSNLGVTDFSLAYFNSLGGNIQPPFRGDTAGVQVIELTVTVQPVASYADTANKHVFSTWKQTRLVSKNLNNR